MIACLGCSTSLSRWIALLGKLLALRLATSAQTACDQWSLKDTARKGMAAGL